MATQLPSCAAVAGEHTELGVEHGVDSFPRRAAYMDGGALGRPILRGDVALWHGAPHRDGQRLVDAGARVCETRRGGIERERDIWGGDGNWGRNTPVTPTAVPQQCHNTCPVPRVRHHVRRRLTFPKELDVGRDRATVLAQTALLGHLRDQSRVCHALAGTGDGAGRAAVPVRQPEDASQVQVKRREPGITPSDCKR